MSKQTVFRAFIGPFQSVHGAEASQFCQTFLAAHFIHGSSVGVAFKSARDSTPGNTSFRLWENGKMTAGQKS